MIWTATTPDRDGALEVHVALHELTHALNGRLHGNVTGLGTNMARGMGEGWSDFYPLALLSETADDRLGTHAMGGYATYQILPGFRVQLLLRYPPISVAVFASRGANGLPHNPLTFRYINADCNTLIGTTAAGPNQRLSSRSHWRVYLRSGPQHRRDVGPCTMGGPRSVDRSSWRGRRQSASIAICN